VQYTEAERRTGLEPRAGVTLIELLVVLAAIAILAAVVGPTLFGNVSDAKVGAARSQIEAYSVALGAYRVDNDAFPSTAQGLAALREAPTTGEPARAWRGPYVAKVIAPDPWGRPYKYEAPGRANPTGFDLYSFGRDGVPGGTGEDADITSWGGAVPQ
jgi:general secretion pathway protein G